MENPITNPKTEIERDLGAQPIATVMAGLGFKSHDLVSASTEHITHKMVARACKGRRLTRNVQQKIQRALSKAASREFRLDELFTY